MVGTGKKIIKNSVWLVSGEVVSKVSIFFLVVIVARNLSIADFGKYNFAMAFVMIFSVVCDLGSNLFLFREIARNNSLLIQYTNNIVTMRVFLSSLFFVLLVVFANIFNYPPDTKELIYIFGVWIILLNFSNAFRISFKAMEVMKWDAIVNVLENVLKLIFVYFAFKMGASILSVGHSYLAASFIAFICSIFIYKRYYSKIAFEFNYSIWLSAFKEMRFLAVVSILIPFFGKFDTVILSHFKDNEAVGIYSAAFKLVWMMLFLPSYLTQATFPKLSQYAHQEDEKFGKLISYLIKSNIIMSLFVSVVISSLSFWIITYIYGNEYIRSIEVLLILIWVFPFFSLSTVLIYSLNAKNKQKTNAIFLGISLFINIMLDLVFVQKYSYTGVAYSTLLSISVLFFMLFTYSVRHRYFHLSQLKLEYQDIDFMKRIFSGRG